MARAPALLRWRQPGTEPKREEEAAAAAATAAAAAGSSGRQETAQARPRGMAFRQALKLAACGLAGGSAAVLFSAVAVGKPRGTGASDAESRWASPEAPTWAERVRPGPTRGVWDSNWDKREPRSLINLRKRSTETGEEEITSKLDNLKARATRHIFLIRHSQYNLDGSLDKDRTLTELGREQAELTGYRLASLGVKFDKIVHSSMTRAIETTDIISKHLPGVNRVSTDLLREGAPIEPDPPVSDWKPEARYYEDGARIEAAFRNFIHRADAKQEEDSYEIFVCHANVIRYIVCRALQFPPEGWLRMSLNNGSITHLVIRPSGRVALRTLGDSGFMPPDKITRT
ncbi:serine/threonine-protein phosphatase PGAM5, mitochondrial isoform X2 [Sarcophilus harrisii]|uniref:Serine/threonine-protein phosphatase PGAM5, mitochondrial n=1 Tax=Sarcophilus harrisii TaxID=9305 RepID=G3W978_SARHA|nr:serine/threonine-protein phosphatase PGAM5, mitochondrial isoform X2 [Sarcophilus harrisii]